ncbi:hypothetical protein ACTXT7_000802 [Hymenolepis weldensis]
MVLNQVNPLNRDILNASKRPRELGPVEYERNSGFDLPKEIDICYSETVRFLEEFFRSELLSVQCLL